MNTRKPNNLNNKANTIMKNIGKANKASITSYVIEYVSAGTIIREVIFCSASDMASKIRTGRIDPKERVYEAELERINKKTFIKQHGIQ